MADLLTGSARADGCTSRPEALEVEVRGVLHRPRPLTKGFIFGSGVAACWVFCGGGPPSISYASETEVETSLGCLSDGGSLFGW